MYWMEATAGFNINGTQRKEQPHQKLNFDVESVRLSQ
jgi:hypothetical protein